MVSALEELGLTNCFDSVHGSSAGAAAGAYFVAGQAALGTRIFFEDLNDQRFISPSRVLRFAPIMDTAYLVDYVMDKIKPIDFKEIQLNSGKLNIVCTDIDAGRSIIYNDFDEYEHYKDVLRASVTLPFIAGRPQEIDGRRLMDAVMALTLQLEVLDKIE
jgi:predicted patatin/cPLA2 family phospholipase